MDQIRIYLQSLPGHLKAAFDILSTGSNDEIETFLHLPLSAIKITSEKCLQKAKQAENSFINIVKLMAELLESLISTKGLYEDHRNRKKITLEVAREEVALVEEERRQLVSRRQKFRESFQEAEKQFEDALTSLPGGWNIFGMAVVDATFSAIKASVDLLSKPFRKSSGRNNTNTSNELSDIDQEKLDNKIRLVHEQAVVLQNIVDCLVSRYVEGRQLKIQEIQSSSKMTYCESQIHFVMHRLKKIEDCPAKKQMEQLCVRVIALCQRLEKERKTFSSDKNKICSVAEEMLLAQQNVNSLVAKLKISVSSVDEVKTPNRKSWQLREISEKGILKYELGKAKAKVEQTCLQLEYAQLRYDEVSRDLHKASSNLSVLLGVMTRVDMELLNVEDIMDLLGRGMKEMGQLRQPWGRIVHFLGTMSNLVDCTLNVTLSTFADTSKSVNKSDADGYNISHFRRDMLYYQVVHAAEIASFMSTIASSYTDVSKEYLLPNIEKLLLFLKFNPETQKTEMRLHSQELKTNCEAAQHGIIKMITQKKADLKNAAKARIARLGEIKKQHLDQIDENVQRTPDMFFRDTTNLNPGDFV